MGDLILSREQPAVVGIVHDAESLAQIKQGLVSNDTCDLLEIRLDALEADLGSAPLPWSPAQSPTLPLLVTARSPREGGSNGLDPGRRSSLLAAAVDHCPEVAAVDIEVSSFEEMGSLLEHTRKKERLLVASFHDFEKTPERQTLLTAIHRAREHGAAVAKIATFLHGPADAAVLLDLLTEDHGIPLAVMGMGPLGGASRLLLAQCGSVLNYGHLGTGNAPGQWHARELKERLSPPA